ncbi:hypothetical protein [Sphingobacterium bovistauri]|uniref:WG containing repeat-containing protein n=1 Tax=Sphingobacterium bovistauri TaxID=2781959 RepID=A0ABS7Z9I1_9SPHI|nr:hypothetical protein [Sphingobacterium bovistauri]MCA5005604.1 hypothetical protein [Sphingobacterium bovistauri]
MKIKLTLLILLISLKIFAQQRVYYPFAIGGLYGIVDNKGNEILPPSYVEELSSNINYYSDYIVLDSKSNNVLLFNKYTGKQENLEYLNNQYSIEINDKKYLYGYNKTMAFLMNNSELDERLSLSKKYKNFEQIEKVYLGYLAINNEYSVVDIYLGNDLILKLSNQEIKNIYAYQMVKNGGFIYCLVDKDKTTYYDENFKVISTINEEHTTYEQSQKYLLEKKSIEINSGESSGGMNLKGYKVIYPHIEKSKNNNSKYVTIDLVQSYSENFPLFRFKWNTNESTSFFISSQVNRIEGSFTKESSKVQILFYVDPVNKNVLLPVKYQKLIDLEFFEHHKSTEKVDGSYAN